jgi:hypothetical protein
MPDFILRATAILLLSIGLQTHPVGAAPLIEDGPGPRDYRWSGHDFAFCFVTDDGRLSNLAWADTARAMDFRFTIAVNHGREASYLLSGEQLHQLAAEGFEIGSHSLTHGFAGLPESCPVPPRGSMMGYFLCEGLDPEVAMTYFRVEIERDSLADYANLPLEQIKVFAYPRHRHGRAVIDSLMAEGYIGARMGSIWSVEENSYGDFTEFPANSWDGGISLFRVPTAVSSAGLFGDHSASPPVHFSYEEFLAVAQPRIDAMRESGGIFVLFDHHLGDDDDSLGDINYGSGGVTRQDLAWMVDLVRASGGVVLTLGEALEYYRARSTMTEVNGDYVWVPQVSAAPDESHPAPKLRGNYPNPFNPGTWVRFSSSRDELVTVSIFDTKGQLIKELASQVFIRGEHEIWWDGRDSKGRAMASGVFLTRVESNSGTEVGKMIMLR